MIKIIDQYIIKHFLFTLLVTALVLLGLFVVIDFFAKIKPFMETRQESVIIFILQYYTYRLPIYLVELLPIITLISAMLTISRFIKRGELISMLSAGMSLRRIIQPILVVAFFLVISTAIANEKLIPLLETKLSHTEKILRFEGVERYLLTHDSDKNSIVIEQYDYSHKTMNNLKMIKFNPDQTFKSVISSERNVWQEKQPGWLSYNGAEYTYDKSGKRNVKHFGTEGNRLESRLTPTDLERTEKSLAYKEIPELISLVRRYPHQLHLKVQLANKVSSPLAIIVLLLLGLPVIFLGETRHFFVGIGICLIVSISFFAVQFFCNNLGAKGVIEPFVAVLSPTVLFGIIGLILFYQVRT